MFIKILVSALIAAAVVFLLWAVRGAMLTPVRVGRSTRLAVTLSVTGREPCLEETVDALLWLRANGTLPGRIVIEDAGMDDETRAAAALMAAGRGDVIFLRGEAEKWKKEAETSK